MNDRELMKRVFDRRCADELSAQEILEVSLEAPRIRSRAPVFAAAAAAAALGVGAAVLLRYKPVPSVSGDPSAKQAENIAAADSVTDRSAADDTSSDPWEPNAVSMPDPLIKNGDTLVTDSTSQSVIYYMDSGAENDLKSLRDQLPQWLTDEDIEKAMVFRGVSIEDIAGAADIGSLGSDSQHSEYLIPASEKNDGSRIVLDIPAGGEYVASEYTIDAALCNELDQTLSHIRQFYPDMSGLRLFSIELTGDFSALFCFNSGGRELAALCCSAELNTGIGFIDEAPINGQVYPFEQIKVWACRSHSLSHFATNSLTCCDFETGAETVKMLTSDQLDRIRSWYSAHEADEVNVPADGHQGDRRFVRSSSAVYAGFSLDGGYAVISRYYGCEDGSEGLCLTVTGSSGTSFRWYSDQLFPDTADITELFDEAMLSVK